MKKISKILMMLFCIIAIGTTAFAVEPTVKVTTQLIERTVETKDRVVSADEAKAIVKKEAPKKKKSGAKHSSVVPINLANAKNVSGTTKSDDLGVPNFSAMATTPTAKKKSDSHMIANFMKIFMPDPTSTTARADHLQVAATLLDNMSIDSLGEPIGFSTSSNTPELNADAFVQLKLGMLALKYQPLSHRTRLDTTFFGAPVGSVDVINENKLTLQCYVFPSLLSQYNCGLEIGGGAQYSHLEGNLKIGGIPIPNDGGGWSSLIQVSYWYYMNRHWALNLGYEWDNLKATSYFPGVPPVSAKMSGQASASLVLGLF